MLIYQVVIVGLFLVPLFLTFYFLCQRAPTVPFEGSSDQPFATVLLPFRNLDYNLEQTVEILLNQNYPEYEIVFVTSEDGKAKRVIEEMIKPYSEKARLVFVTEKASFRSDKINNLQAGIREASSRAKIYAFIDSDIIPSKDWLKNLTAPLKEPLCGVATGTAWIDTEKPDLFALATRYWDFQATTQILFPFTSFARGFSMALRREVFEKLDIVKVWDRAYHDNLTLTDTVKKAGLRVCYAPGCVVSHCFSIRGLQWAGWLKRQTWNTRLYYPRLFAFGFSLIALPRLLGCLGFFVALFDRSNPFLMPFLFWPQTYLLNAFILTWGMYKERELSVRQNLSLSEKVKVAGLASWLNVVFSISSVIAIFSKTQEWRGLHYNKKEQRAIPVGRGR